MFDLTSSKLLILAIVALIVVGPKDLPLLLRTVGRYLGVIRRHANEFRAQLDEAIRESELHEMKKEFESMQREVNSTVMEGARAIDTEAKAAKSGVDEALNQTEVPTAEAVKTETAAEPETQLPEKTGT